MAEGSKLVLTFNTSEEKTATYTFNYAKPSATTAQVRALAQAMVTNTGTLANTLTSVKSAKIVTTTESTYDLSNGLDNSLAIPVYEAYKLGIPVDDFDPNDYDANGVLKMTNDGTIPTEIIVR